MYLFLTFFERKKFKKQKQKTKNEKHFFQITQILPQKEKKLSKKQITQNETKSRKTGLRQRNKKTEKQKAKKSGQKGKTGENEVSNCPQI